VPKPEKALCFQAGCHRRQLNLAFVFLCLFHHSTETVQVTPLRRTLASSP